MSSTHKRLMPNIGLPGFPGIPGSSGKDVSAPVGNAQTIGSTIVGGDHWDSWFFTQETNPPQGPYPQAQSKTQILSGHYSLATSVEIMGGLNDTFNIFFPNYGPAPAVEGETATYVAQLGNTVKIRNPARMSMSLNATAQVFTDYISVNGDSWDVSYGGVLPTGGVGGVSSINFIVIYQ